MFKKIAALAMAVLMLFTLTAMFASCGGASGIKVGCIMVGDESEGYTLAHMNGIKEAAKAVGIGDSQIIWKYKVEENSACSAAADELVAEGCTLIIANSYGHQDFMAESARKYPNVTFVSMTGDFAAISGISNLKNGFTKVYESRYVSGVVGGMKLKQLLDEGTVSQSATPNAFDADGNVKIGYVGAYSYAEVVSGYTAFFLGLRSIVPNVTMEVQYTSSWFDVEKEAAAAEALVGNGCVIIGQHADSTGAPAACERMLTKEGKICYSVGYNVDMLGAAPTAALTSPTNTWSEFYKELFQNVLAGKDQPYDVAKGYNENGVAITKLGDSCAPGTAEKVAEVEAQLKAGTLHVFDTSTFTVTQEQTTCDVLTDANGHLTSCKVNTSYMDWSTMTPIYEGETIECIKDGYFDESAFRSAPYFSVRIDGIIEK